LKVIDSQCKLPQPVVLLLQPEELLLQVLLVYTLPPHLEQVLQVLDLLLQF
jgi:hypothetical protein